MIRKVTVDGKERLAIIAREISSRNEVTELRKALFEVLESCISSDEVKNIISSLSLWYVVQLIQDLEPEGEGGASC